MNPSWGNIVGVAILLTAISWTSPVPDTGQAKTDEATGGNHAATLPDNTFYCQEDTVVIKKTSYTKLDGSGKPLPDSAASWAMVKDNVTGLIWEMKTNRDGVKNYNDPHDADNTYSWFDADPATNGGDAGTPEKGKDTQAFVNALNGTSFGGYSDWRLPTLKELSSIVNYDESSPVPTINSSYFPNTQSSFYWTSTPSPGYDYRAWVIGFDDANGHNYGKYGQYFVRAVRGRLVLKPPKERYWDNSCAPMGKDRLEAYRSW